MILVDLSQIMMASTMMSMEKGQTEADVDFIRHMVLNSLRMYRTEYNEKYGELVICCDSPHSWRREHFPQYKAGRKTGREESPLNWTQIFGCFETIKEELKTVFPYRFIQVDGAEADDIIGYLSRTESRNEKIMIISSDKDFIQLHQYDNVYQWSPVTKKLVNGIEPHGYLFEHILRGDKSDGIPNVLSADNSIVDGVRQKPITKKYVENFVLHNAEISGRSETEIRNFHRNQKLIDLNETPTNLCEKIWEEYQKEPQGKRRDLLNFFVEKRLNNLIETIGDF
jgi:5'-3' exonuclease